MITSNVSSLPSGQLQCEDSIFIPIMRSVDKPSSSLPSHIAMSEDFIRSSVGFRKIDTLKKHFSQLYLPAVTLDNTPADAILD